MKPGSDGAGGLPSGSRAWTMVIVLLLAYVVAVIDRQIMALIVDPVRHDLGIGDARIGLLQGPAFALLYCTMGLPLGRLADRTTRKWIIAAGIFLWSAATIGCGFANSFGELFLCRMGVGVGEAALVPAGLSLIGDSFPPHRQARATATFALGALIGVGMGFLTGGSILALIGQWVPSPAGIGGYVPWRLAFFAVGIPGPILALIIIAFVREPGRTTAAIEQDLGLEQATLRESLGFLLRSRRRYAPFYVSVTMFATIAIPGLTWFPTYLIRNHGFTPAQVGVTLGLIQLVSAVIGASVATLLLERLAKRFEDAHLRTLLCLALICAPAAIVAPLIPDVRIGLLLWFVAQIPLGGYYGVGLNALQQFTPNRVRALNIAIFMLVVNLFGLAVGAAAVGAMTQYVFADPHSVGNALALLFAICGPAAAMACFMGLPKRAKVAPDTILSRSHYSKVPHGKA